MVWLFTLTLWLCCINMSLDVWSWPQCSALQVWMNIVSLYRVVGWPHITFTDSCHYFELAHEMLGYTSEDLQLTAPHWFIRHNILLHWQDWMCMQECVCVSWGLVLWVWACFAITLANQQNRSTWLSRGAERSCTAKSHWLSSQQRTKETPGLCLSGLF